MSLNASLQFFKDIASTKGSGAKMSILALASETDKNVLAYAPDPYHMYGVKKFLKGKYEGMVGALEVDFEGLDDKIGSGISDENRELWARNPDLILNKIVEVNYHEKTKDGHMRHSRYNKIRWDKE